MLDAYSSLLGETEVDPRCVILEGSGTGSKYIVVLDFVPEVINCAIVLVVVVVDVLVLRYCITADPPSPLTVTPQPLWGMFDLTPL